MHNDSHNYRPSRVANTPRLYAIDPEDARKTYAKIQYRIAVKSWIYIGALFVIAVCACTAAILGVVWIGTLVI